MTRFATRGRTRLVLALLAALGVAAAVDGVSLVRDDAVNARIASPEPIADAPSLAPELRFAQAYRLAASPTAASAALASALDRYRTLQPDPRLGAAARFNSANLLVRQALEIRATAQPGQAIPLLELAKELYRDVLRDDPQQFDARYNLERAQRLLADPDEDEAIPAGTPQNAERAATTMRGYAPGLP